MSQENDVFTAEEIAALSVRAVNELIADAEAGRLRGNKELAEVIAGCIRHTAPSNLRDLRFLLDQRALETPPRAKPPRH